MAERLPNGQFDKGNTIGKTRGGRPRKPVEERYLQAVSSAVSMKDFVAAVQAVWAKAMNGDERAFLAVAPYLIGKPTEYVATDVTSDGGRLTFEVVWNRDDAGLPEDAP